MIRHLLLAVLLGGALCAHATAGEQQDEPQPPADTMEQEREEADASMRTWEQRMGELGRRADELSRETRDRLDHAWDDTQRQWEKLQDASRHQWDTARGRLSEAMDRLERAWQSAREDMADGEPGTED